MGMSEHELHDLRKQAPDGLSPRVYWALSLLLVAGYLAVWLANFRYVYGCQIDDWVCYVKGLHTVEDPKAAFTAGQNALQPYFFLYSYLPIWSGVSVPSYELPIYGDQTGNFRFLLLYTVFLHGLIALSWAWFAARIAGGRMAALLSSFLLLTSEEFVLWTPLPETRLIGLPLALLGLWLIIRPDRLPVGAAGPGQRVQPHAARLFLAGSLFWLAQSLHYTALYLIVPMTIALWLWELRGGWRRRGWWLGWAAFAAGCLWLHGLLELASRYWVGLPWSQGPTMMLWRLNQANQVPCRLWESCLHLANQWRVIVGPPLILAALLGAWVWLRRVPAGWAEEPRRRTALVAGLVLGIGMILVQPTVPVFRKFCPLLPFVFLLAGWAIVWLAHAAARWRAAQYLVGSSLLVLIGVIPWQRSAEVFRAHLGLGRAIHWAHQHCEGRPLRWLMIHYPYLYRPADLLADDPENLVIVYRPLQLCWSTSGRLAYSLYAAAPLYRQPNFVASQSIGAGLRFRTTAAARRNDVLCEARVYRAGDLAQHLRTDATLRLSEVQADSSAEAVFEPANLFDRNASPDGIFVWQSSGSPPPHYIRLTLDRAAELSSLALVQRPMCVSWNAPPRLEKLRVRVAAPGGPLRTVWEGTGLEEQQVIIARFERQPAERIELALHSGGLLFTPTDQVEVEEILFPGYETEAPLPNRKLPPLVLDRVELRGEVLVAHGRGITPHTRLLVGGRELLPDFDRVNRESLLRLFDYFNCVAKMIEYRLPGDLLMATGTYTACLTDGLRKSNALAVDLTTGSSPCAPLARTTAAHAANQPATIQARTGAVKQANRQ